jgi:hypothetical protein
MNKQCVMTLVMLAAIALSPNAAVAQSVCLPAPRLLTTTPMGAQVGTQVEVTITGDNLDNVDELLFSHPGITAIPSRDDQGHPIDNKYVVTVAADCPEGIHEARVMSRLGVSSSRVFTVGSLPEVTRQTANTTLDKAMALQLDSICNAVMTRQAVDYYSFEAMKGQRVVVDCAAKGIDSKLKAVLIVADADGNDLLVERRGGTIDFTAPADGVYVVKTHDLTFNGGSPYYYRLALQNAVDGEFVARLPSTESVSSFSWPPAQISDEPPLEETEPNNTNAVAQQITLPCDISGTFFPAADVDVFEFTASKGEVWWVEVASERLGRPTDPSIVVQHVSVAGDKETVTDVVELTDIASPIKVSSNGYSYDGPPYHAGSSDILGKVEIKADGKHRLRLTDLFGGTRNDPNNTYRLIVRKATPDFAIVGWALHMNLRNGDRNALSKPIALRGGSTIAFEVIVVRRDGFAGDIDLELQNLPEGVTATGLTISGNKSRGIMLISADVDAPRGLTSAEFVGRATIDGEVVTRSGRFASMAWPVPDASQQIPSPRLLADIPVSVSGSELATITVTPAEDKVWEIAAGESLKIPLVLTRRCEFSGATISMKTFGKGFESHPAFNIPLDADSSEVTFDLKKLKTPAGDYAVAFYGTAVAKYQYFPEAVTFAETALNRAKTEVQTLKAELQTLTKSAETATDAEKAKLQQAVQSATAKQKTAEQTVSTAEKNLKNATAKAKPKDIADIVVSRPIRIRVTEAKKNDATD